MAQMAFWFVGFIIVMASVLANNLFVRFFIAILLVLYGAIKDESDGR